jgi:hypothetical protein
VKFGASSILVGISDGILEINDTENEKNMKKMKIMLDLQKNVIIFILMADDGHFILTFTIDNNRMGMIRKGGEKTE